MLELAFVFSNNHVFVCSSIATMIPIVPSFAHVDRVKLALARCPTALKSCLVKLPRPSTATPEPHFKRIVGNVFVFQDRLSAPNPIEVTSLVAVLMNSGIFCLQLANK